MRLHYPCPRCGKGPIHVINSRVMPGGGDLVTVRRRRRCAACAYRFTTHEGTEVALQREATRTLRQVRALVVDTVKRINATIEAVDGATRERRVHDD